MNERGKGIVLSLFLVISLTLTGASNIAMAVAWRWPHYCFFDIGSSDLTDRCRQVIESAVASWHREREGREGKSDNIDPKDPYAPPYTAHLRILGYAPDAANPAAADRLSVRRAAAVAAVLQQLGIPNDLITVVGLGDKQLFVPNDRVDPQNRLVYIVFY